MFWGDNVSILFEKDELIYFFPNPDESLSHNLNAITRFFIYISILLMLFTRNLYYIFLAIIPMFVLYLFYKYYPNKSNRYFNDPNKVVGVDDKIDVVENMLDEEYKMCVAPTLDNPFMNANKIVDKYHRPAACQAFLEDDERSIKLREDIEGKFNVNLYRDVGDLYGKSNSQREFYTMPSTTFPNDQTSFAKWCYKTGPTCKEMGSKCAPYWNINVQNQLLNKL